MHMQTNVCRRIFQSHTTWFLTTLYLSPSCVVTRVSVFRTKSVEKLLPSVSIEPLHTHSARLTILTFIITSGSALIGQHPGMAASDWRILSRDNTQRAHNTTHQRERAERAKVWRSNMVVGVPRVFTSYWRTYLGRKGNIERDNPDFSLFRTPD